jgi:uncharacterized protein (TIGR01777 family)
MKPPKIIVAGGSGFIGRPLCRALFDDARREVWVLSRQKGIEVPYAHVVSWDGLTPGSWQSCLEGAAAVINLCGAKLAEGRWTARRRQELTDSRLLPTAALAAAISSCAKPPRVFISASSVAYYGPRGEDSLDESSGPGGDFLSKLCVEWEAAAAAVPPSVRTVLLRTGLVMAEGGGPLRRILLPYRFGLGGPVGTGRQYLSWISREDLIGLILHLLESGASGPVNATAPEPVPQEEFARAIGRALGPIAQVRLPGLARLALGDLSEMLVGGQRALPLKATKAGYAFRHPSLDAVLAQCVG